MISAARDSEHLSDSRENSQTPERLITRKIWLPKFLYDALPYFYFFSGAAALLATLYISDWFWVLPHYLMFSVACLHLGVVVYRRRRQNRSS